ncbi:hypothetical protein JW905_10335 [bacterium]|nr:hypothetical protein [candidate division CSSED10-310 bacterium]
MKHLTSRRVAILTALLTVAAAAFLYLTAASPEPGWARFAVGEDGRATFVAMDPCLDFNGDRSGQEWLARTDVQWEWRGSFDVPITSDYVFSTFSDDGSRLWIDDVLAVDNWSIHGPELVTGGALLEQGRHRLVVRYFNAHGGAVLQCLYRLGMADLPMDAACSAGVPGVDAAPVITAARSIVARVLPFLLALSLGGIVVLVAGGDRRSREQRSIVWIFVMLALLISIPRIAADGFGYFGYLHSLIIDRDLAFANEMTHEGEGFEYNLRYVVERCSRTPKGYVPNFWAVGPAILWLPFYLASLLWNWLMRLVDSGFVVDGFSYQQVLVIGIGACFWGCMAVAAGISAARRAGAGTKAWSGALVAMFGTTMFCYTVIEVSFAHAISAFTVALYVLVWLKLRSSDRLRHWFYIGAAGGLMVLCYWQNALLLAMSGLDLAVGLFDVMRRRIRAAPWALRLLSHGLGTGLLFLPQSIIWMIMYGTPLTIPQGVPFAFGGPTPFRNMLFSPYHGLLIWTPLALPALLGLVHLRKPLGGAWWRMAAALVLFILHSGILGDWFGGGAFGMRRFTNIYIFFVMGMAAFLARRAGSRWPPWVCGIGIAWTMLLLADYRSGTVGTPCTYGQLLYTIGRLQMKQISGVFFSSGFSSWFANVLQGNDPILTAGFVLYYLLLMILAGLGFRLLLPGILPSRTTDPGR